MLRTLFEISSIYLIKTNLELFSPQQNRINLTKAKLTKPSFSIGKVGAFIASFGDSPPLFPLLQGFWEKWQNAKICTLYFGSNKSH